MTAALPSIEASRASLARLEAALELEWLETDGTGSFASSTAAGCNTRRYHGLLVAARRPPADRAVLVSRLDETLLAGGEAIELGTNEYPGAIHPQGWRRIARFRVAPFPETTWAAGGALLVREVFLARGRRTVIASYRLEGTLPRAELVLRPVLACRPFHELAPAGAAFRVEAGRRPGVVRVVSESSGDAVSLSVPGAAFERRPLRFHRVRYREEAARGLDFEEELHGPGEFRIPLERSRTVWFLAAAGDLEDLDPAAERERELARRRSLVAAAPGLDPSLVLAADAFLVGGAHVIAGYPWFDVWGRDAFLSLEGLALATGRAGDARDVLLAGAERVVDGLVPNYLAADPAADAFHSIDASLWFVHAVGRYLEVTGDADTVAGRLWPTVVSIVDAYRRGTRFGIGVEAGGLVAGGGPDTQLTWMDARCDGRPVTPRHGKAVEIQALWYNALRTAAGLAGRFGGPDSDYDRLARSVRDAFEASFPLPGEAHLADRIAGDEVDAALRPNQLLAISLPHPILARERFDGVLEAVSRRLATPFGLRTLDPTRPDYVGRYAGGPRERDGAYHRGTIWPWLLGPWLGALVAARGPGAATRRAIESALAVWPAHLADACLGQVSEVFEGDPPHSARGAYAQAWSVAELLRIQHLLGSL